MLVFGGWSNRWLNDIWKANVSNIIGPPYACVDVLPKIGPVFGNTTLTLKGLRFREGKAQVAVLETNFDASWALGEIWNG